MITWSPGKTLAEIEKEIIEVALRFYGGNKSQTARALDISIRTIDNKMTKYKELDEQAIETSKLDIEQQKIRMAHLRGHSNEAS